MKSLFGGLCTAFSMYSILPVPTIPWTDTTMRYAMCCFPLIGVVTGGLSVLWYMACAALGLTPALYAAVAVLLPLLVSGGIHMDGFMDTADAVSSHAGREKKLEILKDSRVGAFGVLYCVGYLLLSFALWQQLYVNAQLLVFVAGGFVLSRSLSALSVASFPTAKNTGLVHLFADKAAKQVVIGSSIGFVLVLVALGALVSPLWSAVFAVAAVLYFLLHRSFCLRIFGGNTGDLAGFFVQVLELLLLAVAAVGGQL